MRYPLDVQYSAEALSCAVRRQYHLAPFRSTHCHPQMLPSAVIIFRKAVYSVRESVIEAQFCLDIFCQRHEPSADNSKFVPQSLQSRAQNSRSILKHQLLPNRFIYRRWCPSKQRNSSSQRLLKVNMSLHCQFCDFLS
jgi:hypothetical protein